MEQVTQNRLYRVHGADTLWGIARDQLGDPNLYREIYQWNNLTSFVLRPGQILKLFNSNKEDK